MNFKSGAIFINCVMFSFTDFKVSNVGLLIFRMIGFGERSTVSGDLFNHMVTKLTTFVAFPHPSG